MELLEEPTVTLESHDFIFKKMVAEEKHKHEGKSVKKS